jgi:exopolysaccharide production protein ExoZ
MWTITSGGAAPGSFLALRVTRVVPSYWAITAVTAGLAVAWPDLVPQIRFSWPHLLLSLGFIPHFDPLGQPFPLLPAGWTLTYEAAFYLIFAAALLLPRKARALTVTLVLLAIGCAGYFDATAYGLGANFMLAEFALGLWIGRIAEAEALPTPVPATVLTVGALAAFALTNSHAFSDAFLRPLWWGLASGALVMGALGLEAAGRVPAMPPLRVLGDASYAIYLAHTAAIALVVQAIGRDQPAPFMIAALAAATAAGLAWRALVEKPLIALARAPLRRSIGRIHSIDWTPSAPAAKTPRSGGEP